MEHQDWNNIIINNASTQKKISSNNSNRIPSLDNIKMEAPTNLGQLISQSRTTKGKTQKILANEIGISQQILSRWESGKEIPTNSDIAKLEKILCIKLPRCKKVKIDTN